MHGTDSTVQLVENDGALRELSPDDFAVVVRNTGRDGQPIRLFSCDTGASPNGFAQELADELGVAVTAPDNLVWSDSFGGLAQVASAVEVAVIGPDGEKEIKLRPKQPNDGRWIVYTPSKNR